MTLNYFKNIGIEIFYIFILRKNGFRNHMEPLLETECEIYT